jgi:hypothetical protein
MTYCDLWVMKSSTPGIEMTKADEDNIITGKPNNLLRIDEEGLGLCVEAQALLKGKYNGQAIDWGTIGSKMTKSQVLQFIEELYDSPEKIAEKKQMVTELSDDDIYVVAAMES